MCGRRALALSHAAAAGVRLLSAPAVARPPACPCSFPGRGLVLPAAVPSPCEAPGCTEELRPHPRGVRSPGLAEESRPSEPPLEARRRCSLSRDPPGSRGVAESPFARGRAGDDSVPLTVVLPEPPHRRELSSAQFFLLLRSECFAMAPATVLDSVLSISLKTS